MTEHTPLTELQINVLMSDLKAHRVSERDGLSYLEAWDVRATLIRVFGFGGFSVETMEPPEVMFKEQVPQVKDKTKMNWKVSVMARVKLTIHQTGAVYTGCAVGDGTMPDISESLDKATKTAESDALKRAATNLGTQFGLSLYKKLTNQQKRNGQISIKDVVRLIVAPGQERNLPQPISDEQKKEGEARVNRAFSPYSDTHGDKALEDALNDVEDQVERLIPEDGSTADADAAVADGVNQ